MKRNYPLLFFILLGISFLSGNLTAGISFIGKTGVNIIYKEYQFFKVWWQSAIVCFLLFIIIFLLLFFVDKNCSESYRKIISTLLLIIFLLSLYFTFRDFRHYLPHRWLGERFHTGIYLYWIGYSIIALFYITTNKIDNSLE